MRSWCIRALVGVLLLGATRCWAQAEAPVKQAPPDQATLRAATSQIRDAFKAELAGATKPEEKGQFCRKLVKTAREERDAGLRYALLIFARDVATDTGDLELVLATVDELDNAFQVDTPELKANAVSTAWRSLRTPDERKKFAAQLEPLVKGMIAAERYDLAAGMADFVALAARISGEPAGEKAATAQLRHIREMDARHREARLALAVLEKEPKDPDANLRVGRFRCFYRQDWDSGLPMLALCSDPKLKALAAMELAKPQSAEERLKLADGWFDLAAGLSGAVQASVRSRAAMHYAAALPGLNGLAKARVESRLKQTGPAQAAPTPQSNVSIAGIVQIHARADDRVELRLNGQQVLEASQWNPRSANIEIKPGDVLTAKCLNPSGLGAGVAVAIRPESGEWVLATGLAPWQQYEPANRESWFDPRGIGRLRAPAAGSNKEIASLIAEYAHVPVQSIWGSGHECYLCLVIPPKPPAVTPKPQPALPAGALSLTTLKPESATVGESQFTVDEYPPAKQRKPMIGEWVASSFLFAHAPSKLKYAIPEGYKTFNAIGYSFEHRSMSFVVRIDDKEAFRSESLSKYAIGYVPISVKIPPGSKFIELSAEHAGDKWRQHSAWCVPFFGR